MEATLWPVAIPVVSVVVVGIGIFIANSSKYFTIREHDAFHRSIQRDLASITKRIDDIQYTNKDIIEDIRDRIKVLEQTRPTTGELQAALRTGIVSYKDPKPRGS